MTTRRGLSALRALVCGTLFVCAASQAAPAQPVSAPWSARDIGAPALSGSAFFASGVFTIDAAGVDIWNSADQFHFVYQAVAGDADIRARVDSLTAAHVWSKAGVMIRRDLSAGSPHAYALVSSDRGVAFQRRVQANGLSTHSPGPLVSAPRWVRLVRRGSSVTAYSSADGASWTAIGSDTIPLGSTAYVGLAVTSHNEGMRTTSRISSVALGTRSLPAGQQHADIGAPAVAGDASYAQGAYTVRAAGIDIWDSSDQFHFVFKPISGDGEIIARVASLRHTHDWAKAGVMIRESLAAGSRHAYALVSAGRGYAFQRRVQTGQWSEHTGGGSGSAPGWVRLTRTGSLFEAYRSADGSRWTRIGARTIPMGQTVYAGIAVTSHNAGAGTTAVVDNLRITGIEAPVFPPRHVVFTASTDHATGVTTYLFEVFPARADPGTATPVASSDLGKPPVRADGDISVDRATFFQNLPVGSYIGTVSAVGPGGRSRSTAVAFTR